MAERNTPTAGSGETNTLEIIRQAFDAHPLDVVATVNTASEVFYWLEELLHAIQTEASGHVAGLVLQSDRPVSLLRIKKLADMASYLTTEHANYLDGVQEDYMRALRNAGIGEQEVRHD